MYSTFNMLQDKFLKQINSRVTRHEVPSNSTLPTTLISYQILYQARQHKTLVASTKTKLARTTHLAFKQLTSTPPKLVIKSNLTLKDGTSIYHLNIYFLSSHICSLRVISLAVEVQVLGVQYHLQEGEPQSFNFLSRQIPFSSKAKQSVNRIHNMDINDFISDHVGEWFYKLFPASRIHSHKNT
uniref:Uncharacterized protein n=1 Tax=Rhizophagus irregularis (strain DAOM 181602 / DAOM 197198 / MUCL 43194) TaxID=747089 RepID=U9TQ92_RHIID